MFAESQLPALVESFAVQIGPGGPAVAGLLIVRVILSVALGYWVFADENGRGSDDPLLWAVLVGGFTYLSFVVGLVTVVLYIWRREQRTGGIGPSRGRDAVDVSSGPS